MAVLDALIEPAQSLGGLVAVEVHSADIDVHMVAEGAVGVTEHLLIQRDSLLGIAVCARTSRRQEGEYAVPEALLGGTLIADERIGVEAELLVGA